jgi:3-oxoacyl-[acyl-carrier-protein] synthase-3
MRVGIGARENSSMGQQSHGRRAVLKAIRSFLPASKLTNDALANEFKDWEVEKIYAKTGIAVRSIAGAQECASDLAVAAAEQLFGSGVVSRDRIDYLLFCTQSPDYFLPTTACIIQDRLGLSTNCAAIDINQGCSGYVYGLSLAKGVIECGIASNVLLLTAETYSKHIHPGDRSVRTIFGDGAAATWITAEERDSDAIGPFVLGTNGSGAKQLIVPTGGMRRSRDHETAIEKNDSSGNVRTEDNLFMNGGEIFAFTLKTVPGLISETLKKAQLSMDDIDLFVFHQANRYMLEQLRAKTKIAPERFCINMESYGNTVSSTIPMALEIEIANGRIGPGDTVMLVGFGVGYSWGSCIIRIDHG